MPVKYLEPGDEFQYLMTQVPNQLIVLDFTASWCGPCRAISPHLDKLSLNYPNVLFYKVDIDTFPELATQLKVSGVPNFKFIMNGRLLHEFSGANLQMLQHSVDNLYVQIKDLPSFQIHLPTDNNNDDSVENNTKTF